MIMMDKSSGQNRVKSSPVLEERQFSHDRVFSPGVVCICLKFPCLQGIKKKIFIAELHSVTSRAWLFKASLA